MSIHVVGGTYSEYCVHPEWNELYGSGGRAAVALAEMGSSVQLHTYLGAQDLARFRGAFALYGARLLVDASPTERAVRFKYVHDSAEPTVTPAILPTLPPIPVKEAKVVRFGMMEGDAVVDADLAVYDPQSPGAPVSFGRNGSSARRLALVLNLAEARALLGAGVGTAEECAPRLAAQEGAEVVVIKQGPRGALVWDKGQVGAVPAFRTESVWKIGSGDCFVAHFALCWMEQGTSALEAAATASRAVAYYCQYRSLPAATQLKAFQPAPVQVGARCQGGAVPKVYLAGPFFDLSQIWLVDEAQRNLRDFGLDVFSPFHDVGFGPSGDVVEQDLKALDEADIVYAIAGGADPGTIFEVGYARARGKPVVIYSEREPPESMKMAEGSDCRIFSDYTTSLYEALWTAVQP